MNRGFLPQMTLYVTGISITIINTQDNLLIKRKRWFSLKFLIASVIICWPLCLGDSDKRTHTRGNTWQSRADHLIARVQNKREADSEIKPPFKVHSQGQEGLPLGHTLLKIPPPSSCNRLKIKSLSCGPLRDVSDPNYRQHLILMQSMNPT